LFFQLVASRYETGSIILTSNLSFSRWGETLGDDVVAVKRPRFDAAPV